MYTTCEAGKRRTVNHTRARARSPRRAAARRGAAGRDVQARRGVMAILPLTAINRAIKRAIKSVINGHNRIT